MSAHDEFVALKARMKQGIIGQEAVIDRMLIALLADGHILLEGLPGLAKTRAIKTLAKNLESKFSRVQFTPDLLPADVTGSEIYYSEGGQGQFRFQEGPLFGNLILADEINRAPAKVQSALLEAMEERQVTVAGKTHKLPDLFFVLATQNPIEQEGTYPLPEAQMDRFLMHVVVQYPDVESERAIMRLVRSEQSATAPLSEPIVMKQDVVLAARQEIQKVQVSDVIENYIVALVTVTRQPQQFGEKLKSWIHVGSSPRGTLALDRTSRAHAWLNGRDIVLPDDVKAVVADCLRHRLILSFEASADGITGDDVIAELISQVAVA